MSKITATLALALIMVVAACGDDDAGTPSVPDSVPPTTATTVAPATTTATAPTTTAGPVVTRAALPDTSVQALITDGYVFGNAAGGATDADLPFALGSINARWYTAGGWWVVVYEGLDLDETGPLCPGNSILNSGSNAFEAVSNSPSPGAECIGAPNVAEDAVMVCDGQVSYLTQIPTGIAGLLFASVEVYPGDGFNLGASGSSFTDGTGPEIDLATLSC